MRVEQLHSTEATESQGGEGETFEVHSHNPEAEQESEQTEGSENEQAVSAFEDEPVSESSDTGGEMRIAREAADQERISEIKVELAEIAPFAVEVRKDAVKNESKVELKQCEACKGTGKRYFLFKCQVCKGSGRVPKSITTSQTKF